MDARFPLTYSRKLEKSVLWKKIDELNLLKHQVNKYDEIRDLIFSKIQDYQSRKEDFLRNPERVDRLGIIQDTTLDLQTSNFEVTNLIIKELNIDLRVSSANLELFITNLKTLKAKKRAFYYLVDSCIKQREGYTSKYEVNRAEFKRITTTVKSIFECLLDLSDMDDILIVFKGIYSLFHG